MTFKEAKDMEDRIMGSVRDILLKYPDADYVEFNNTGGVKEKDDPKLLFDMLNADALLYLKNKQVLPVQVKCGTRRNFLEVAKDLRSFTFGDYNDITGDRFLDQQIKSCHLLLTGYEVKKGILDPYCGIIWRKLLQRFDKGSLTVFNPRNSVKKHKKFGWSKIEDIKAAGIVVPGMISTKYFDDQK
jgi:hypothetical protein